jgi:hypothetical protein
MTPIYDDLPIIADGTLQNLFRIAKATDPQARAGSCAVLLHLGLADGEKYRGAEDNSYFVLTSTTEMFGLLIREDDGDENE